MDLEHVVSRSSDSVHAGCSNPYARYETKTGRHTTTALARHGRCLEVDTLSTVDMFVPQILVL